MNEAKGLCICLSGDEHDKVHDIYDTEEEKLGVLNNPQYVDKLITLETLAAEVISKVTGCSQDKLLQEMQAYHENLKFNDETLVRADPYGNSGLSIEKMGEHVSGSRKSPTKIDF